MGYPGLCIPPHSRLYRQGAPPPGEVLVYDPFSASVLSAKIRSTTAHRCLQYTTAPWRAQLTNQSIQGDLLPAFGRGNARFFTILIKKNQVCRGIFCFSKQFSLLIYCTSILHILTAYFRNFCNLFLLKNLLKYSSHEGRGFHNLLPI